MKSEPINVLSDTELFLLKINACYEPELSVKGTRKAIEIIQNQMKQIDQLTNNWNELEEWIEEEYLIVKANRIEEPNNYEWYIKINERRNMLDKMKEIKEGK